MKEHNLQSFIISSRLVSCQRSYSKSSVSIVKVCSIDQTQPVKGRMVLSCFASSLAVHDQPANTYL